MDQSVACLAPVTTTELIAKLTLLARAEPCVLAFDGDGTLWSGDVSDDVFFAACEQEWFLEDARDAMCRPLEAHGCSTVGSIAELCRRLHEEQMRGTVPERLLFEAMTYCYAGRTAAEVTEFASRVLEQQQIRERLRQGLIEVITWARRAGHRCIIVSASPSPIVAVPAQMLGFDERNVIAGRATHGALGRIGNHIEHPLPYRDQKVTQLRARIGNHRLLAAFGDSPFDLHLLDAAELAVAVEPKPALFAELSAQVRTHVVHWKSGT
jgi:HAD superfamily phosphoserine phosphatase-like hydrolase